MSLAGVSSPEDVLLTCWHNDTFRPCHYVAIDRARRNIILAVRGSLEVSHVFLIIINLSNGSVRDVSSH